LMRKPKDVAVPITVRAKRYPTSSEVLTLANFGPSAWFDAIFFEKWTTGRTKFWIPNTACHYVDYRNNWTRIQWRRNGVIWLGSAVGASMLGGVHALAWKSTFPTKAEKDAWRITSMLTVGIPWAYMVLGNITLMIIITFAKISANKERKLRGENNWFSAKSNPYSYICCNIMRFPAYVRVCFNSYYATLSFLAISVYTAARVFLLVEAIRSLLFLPPAAYIATWEP